MGSPKCRPLKTKALSHRKAHPTHAPVQLASRLLTCQGPHIHAGQLLSWQRPPAGQEAFGLAGLLGWPGGFWPGKATRVSRLDGFVLSGLSPSYRPGRAPAGSWDASNQAGLPTAAGQPAFNPAGPPGPARWLLTWQDLPGRPGVFWPGRASSASWPASYWPAGSLHGFFPGSSPWLAGCWPGWGSQAGHLSPGRAPLNGQPAFGLAQLAGQEASGLVRVPQPVGQLFQRLKISLEG